MNPSAETSPHEPTLNAETKTYEPNQLLMCISLFQAQPIPIHPQSKHPAEILTPFQKLYNTFLQSHPHPTPKINLLPNPVQTFRIASKKHSTPSDPISGMCTHSQHRTTTAKLNK